MSGDKSLDHVYSVGERVFDLPTEQFVTILKITLMHQSDPFAEYEYIDFQSAKDIVPDDIDAGIYNEDDTFMIIVDALPTEDWPDDVRIFNEICLPEEAEIYRGFAFMASDEMRAARLRLN